ncbi:Scr1 family TA system antitoxin-like transcriptional regulator [Streptomyces sp. NPDC007088]|uniref:Scr1 family TA system antitoxin-like transcriptional regulator n=1 Tax=Streptomyces sp. NPDC007088 TaxID=3364773 RepID=UPI0036ACAF33
MHATTPLPPRVPQQPGPGAGRAASASLPGPGQLSRTWLRHDTAELVSALALFGIKARGTRSLDRCTLSLDPQGADRLAQLLRASAPAAPVTGARPALHHALTCLGVSARVSSGETVLIHDLSSQTLRTLTDRLLLVAPVQAALAHRLRAAISYPYRGTPSPTAIPLPCEEPAGIRLPRLSLRSAAYLATRLALPTAGISSFMFMPFLPANGTGDPADVALRLADVLHRVTGIAVPVHPIAPLARRTGARPRAAGLDVAPLPPSTTPALLHTLQLPAALDAEDITAWRMLAQGHAPDTGTVEAQVIPRLRTRVRARAAHMAQLAVLYGVATPDDLPHLLPMPVHLTSEEQAVFEQHVLGHTPRQIAESVSMSTTEVCAHLQMLQEVLHCSSSVQLRAHAVAHRIAHPAPPDTGRTTPALRIACWAPELIPPPLRAPQYHASVLRLPAALRHDEDDALPSVTTARGSGNYSAVIAVIAEQALTRVTGSAAAMEEQLRYLLALLRHPAVDLAVLPARLHLPLLPPAAFVLHPGAGTQLSTLGPQQITDAETVRALRRAFDQLRREAVSGEKARPLLRSALRKHARSAGAPCPRARRAGETSR